MGTGTCCERPVALKHACNQLPASRTAPVPRARDVRKLRPLVRPRPSRRACQLNPGCYPGLSYGGPLGNQHAEGSRRFSTGPSARGTRRDRAVHGLTLLCRGFGGRAPVATYMSPLRGSGLTRRTRCRSGKSAYLKAATASAWLTTVQHTQIPASGIVRVPRTRDIRKLRPLAHPWPSRQTHQSRRRFHTPWVSRRLMTDCPHPPSTTACPQESAGAVSPWEMRADGIPGVFLQRERPGQRQRSQRPYTSMVCDTGEKPAARAALCRARSRSESSNSIARPHLVQIMCSWWVRL
jgi:hypothetical protein